jgi:hypothetical protein
MRRTGSFELTTSLSWSDRLSLEMWAAIENVGNPVFDWGEEIEVIGIKQ